MKSIIDVIQGGMILFLFVSVIVLASENKKYEKECSRLERIIEEYDSNLTWYVTYKNNQLYRLKGLDVIRDTFLYRDMVNIIHEEIVAYSPLKKP